MICYALLANHISIWTDLTLEGLEPSGCIVRFPKIPKATLCTEIKAGESIVTIRTTRRIAGKVIFGTRTLGSGWRPSVPSRRFWGGGERKRRMERGETHRRAPVITQDGRQTSADFNNDRCTAGGLSGWWSIVRKSTTRETGFSVSTSWHRKSNLFFFWSRVYWLRVFHR